MSHKPWEPLRDANSPPRPGEFVATFADRMALRERERVEWRRLALAEQTAGNSTPTMRIRAWERVHDLRLPSAANHPILDVIAAQTGLTLAEISEEQSARLAAKSA
ncbi:MAG: hypothetical protein ABW278_00120 [Steroidobacteraceae bacterium]